MKLFDFMEPSRNRLFYKAPNPDNSSDQTPDHEENQTISAIRLNKSAHESSSFRLNKIVPEPSSPPNDLNLNLEKDAYSGSVNSRRNFSPVIKLTSKSSDVRKSFYEARKSFARFTENLGKITKHAVNELTDSVKQTDFKEEYRKGLIKALNFLDIGASKNPFLKFLKTILFFNIQVFIFVMNAISVVNLVLVSDYRLNQISQDYEPILKMMEWALGAFFSLEVVLEILFNYYGFLSIFYILLWPGNIIDILLVLEITYSTLYINNFKPRIWIFTIIGFLRSLKLIKLRKIIDFNLKELRKIIENEKLNIDLAPGNDEEDKFSVMSSVIDICVGIFIQATAYLTIDELLNYNAFNNPGNFTYISASYFAIVSLTTIGYGDVTPNVWESMAFVNVMLLFNITVLSTYIANLTDRIKKLSPFVRNYSFKGHVVIIGDIPLTFLQFFIEEVNQNEMVQKRLAVKKKDQRINFIVVGKEEPTKEIDYFLHSFSYNEKNGDAVYLKSNIMEQKWFKQTNLQYAKHLFAFSINMKDSEAVAFEKDKQLAFNIQNIINNFPKLAITLTLTSEYEENIGKDSLWKNVQTVPFRLLNSYIMANSIENQGFNTWLVHLLTLREKKEPLLREDSQKNSLMQDYSENMRQEIYPMKLPPFFIGKTFIEAAKVIYFSSIEFLDYLLLKPESGEIPKYTKELKQFALQLIAIQVKSEDIFSNSSKILINPVNHIIEKDEIGYVIALDQESSEHISGFSTESPLYLRYLRNMNLIRKENENRFKETNFKESDIMSQIQKNIDSVANNWTIMEDRWRTSNRNMGNTQYKSFNYFEDKQTVNDGLPTLFNLYQDMSPRGLFKNHLIVKGNITEMSSLAYIIRFYSERPILLFTDHKINYGIWAKIKANYANVFVVLGNANLVKHVEQLDPKKAFKILILSSSRDELIQDSCNVIFTRILADFFEAPNFLVELLDENNMRFISTKPQITINNDLDYFFWPYFVRGSVHFSSLIMSILARALYNKYWVVFLKNLAKPKDDDFRASQEVNAENSNIMSFEITKEIANEVQIYGKLQYFLMNNDPPGMAIALLKEKSYITTSKRKRVSDFTCGDAMNRLKAMFATHFLKTLDELYHYSYLMTNPSFMTQLDVGDKVLFLGSPQRSRGGKRMTFLKEAKVVPKIRVYLNKNSIDRENLKKEEKKRVLRFFMERKKIWKSNDRRMEYKEKLMSLLGETNKMIRFTLENYRNVFEEEDEEDF